MSDQCIGTSDLKKRSGSAFKILKIFIQLWARKLFEAKSPIIVEQG